MHLSTTISFHSHTPTYNTTTPHAAHRTPHTAHRTPHTAHRTAYSVQCTVTLYTVHSSFSSSSVPSARETIPNGAVGSVVPGTALHTLRQLATSFAIMHPYLKGCSITFKFSVRALRCQVSGLSVNGETFHFSVYTYFAPPH